MKRSKKFHQLFCLGLITGGFYACDFTEPQDPIMKDEAEVLFSTASPQSNFIFFDDFDSGNDPLFMAHSHELGANHSLTAVTKPNFPNEKAARFELRDDDPLVKRSIRAEVTIVHGREGHIEKDTWYGFDLFVPEDYADEDNTEQINQWHQDGDASAAINIRNGRLFWRFFIDGNKKDFDLGALNKGKWSNFIIHMVHSYGSDGVTEVWLDGKKLIDERGRNINDTDLPKWKIGIYKWTWADRKTTVSRRVLLFDNVRVGDSRITYDEMAYFSEGNTENGDQYNSEPSENEDQSGYPVGENSDTGDSSDEETSNGDPSADNDDEKDDDSKISEEEDRSPRGHGRNRRGGRW